MASRRARSRKREPSHPAERAGRRLTYPVFGNWGWGGGWLSQLGSNFGLGHGYADFAGSGVVHSVGGWMGLAGAVVLGPRIGKYNKDGSPNTILGHSLTIA